MRYEAANPAPEVLVEHLNILESVEDLKKVNTKATTDATECPICLQMIEREVVLMAC
jgi:hypothetical protein